MFKIYDTSYSQFIEFNNMHYTQGCKLKPNNKLIFIYSFPLQSKIELHSYQNFHLKGLK